MPFDGLARGSPPMRIRIIRPQSGEIDGLDLGRFEVGSVYEVGSSVATYLITTRAAEPVAASERPDSTLTNRKTTPT
jgi:hypothetical protein